MGGFIYQCPNTRLRIQAFMADPVIERVIRTGISELMVTRLTMFQALWARELQRALDPGRPAAGAEA